jgi:hypothetical protein
VWITVEGSKSGSFLIDDGIEFDLVWDSCGYTAIPIAHKSRGLVLPHHWLGELKPQDSRN